MFLRTNKPILITLTLAVVIIATTYFFAKSRVTNTEKETETDNTQIATTTFENIRSMDANEHILGNPNAEIKFFVYSDFSCSFCKDYHKTLKTIMMMYGSEGDVAVIFRHMPLVQLHPESPMYAVASECVTQEAGNAGFWKFADLLFKETDPLKPLGAADLVVFAESVGVSRQAFVACMRANELMPNIERDFQEGINAGAEGSPFTVLDMYGIHTSLQGIQSYRTLALMLQTALRSRELDGKIKSPSESVTGDQSFVNEFYLYDMASSSSTSTKNTSTSTSKAN
jgi:protein-disulfide isomerase